MRAAAHTLAAPPQITRDRHLISPVVYLLYTPLLPDVAGGVVDPRFNTIPLSDNLTGVRLICGYVDAVDFPGTNRMLSRSGKRHPGVGVRPARTYPGLDHSSLRHSRLRRACPRPVIDRRSCLSS
jgi:hypothetical protein